MRVAVIGAGYVGLVASACLASVGHRVTCVDKLADKVASLKRGVMPIYEPGLEALVVEQSKAGRLSFTADIGAAVETAELVILAVGTPTRSSDGHADLRFVFDAAREVAHAARSGLVIATKSTVPVGTGDEIAALIQRERPDLDCSVASNPEFLREGMAIDDFLQPDRIVIGSDDGRGRDAMSGLYAAFADRTTILHTDRRSAELLKYASNAFLAMKITFINEMADLAEAVGGNIRDIAAGVGLDSRIGAKFLRVGPGYGGSCFPKDTMAIAKTARDNKVVLRTVETVIQTNADRKRAMAIKVVDALGGNIAGKTIAVLGLTFKAETDDMRESPSIPLVQAMLDFHANVRVHDPEGMENARAILDQADFCETAEQAAMAADAVVVVTEWKQYRDLDLTALATGMRHPVMIDLRNLFSRAEAESAGFIYHCLGERMVVDPALERRSR
jgi:UDPglucose 6-dehydrogenase